MVDSFFSIIVPTYNSEKSIHICLASIFNQSFPDYEVIIIDGGSTDETIETIKKFIVDNRNIRFISEPDLGVYDAMNKGMNLASGKWLYFLGSDDKLYSKTILKEIFESALVGEYQVLYGNVEVVGNTSWAVDGNIYDGEFDFRKLLAKNLCHQAIFYKREFIKEEIGDFNIKYKLCADWDFNLRCWAKTNFLYIPKIIACFCAGGKSSLSNTDRCFYNDFAKNISIYFNLPLLRQGEVSDNSKGFCKEANRLWKVNFKNKILSKLRYFVHSL